MKLLAEPAFIYEAEQSVLAGILTDDHTIVSTEKDTLRKLCGYFFPVK
jgi:hypothetical protein